MLVGQNSARSLVSKESLGIVPGRGEEEIKAAAKPELEHNLKRFLGYAYLRLSDDELIE